MFQKTEHPRAPRRVLAIALLLAGAGVAFPAASQDVPDDAATPPPATDESEDPGDKAKRLVKQAIAIGSAGRLEEARQMLLEAFALSPTFDVAGNLGAVELQMGLHRDAAEHLDQSLREYPPTAATDVKDRTRDLLAEAKKHVSWLQIRVNVPGAEVAIDGKTIEQAKLAHPQYVEPGRRTVTATLSGYQPATVAIDTVAGQPHPVELTLQPLLERDPAKPEDAVAKSRTPAVVLGTLGGVLSAAGIGMLAGAAVTNSDLDDSSQRILEQGFCQPARPASLQSLCDEHESATTKYNVLIIAGGVSLGAGLLSLITLTGYELWPSAESAPTKGAAIRLVPVADGDFQGLYLRGQF